AHTTAALIGVSHTLLSKSGGYLRNDVLPPWSLLDNMPSWERGVVIELRDSVRALRNDFSREQTQSAEDRDLAQADAQFHFDDSHWMLPATEEEFAAGTEALRRYLHRLHTSGSEQARFFVRADNLNFYLATVGKRLGAYAQQLSGNVLGPSAGTRGAEQGAGAEFTRTPWKDVDNVFYEARGYAWALLHTLRGIERDFGNVIEAKAADGALEQIIRKLEETQATVRSPLILNTSGFGLLTNHSLVMASYMSRANAALIELRQLIAEG
ncbi:MAG: DUF2333 family protein, partial [Gammaproteobacteria bacterium]|nr:DUF2333 family protein [Gammaproteobacteria bacterium]